jgi:hypothetical protein
MCTEGLPGIAEETAGGFPVSEPLRRTGCKHCVSLFLLEKRYDAVPTPEHHNATLTLIEFEGRLYGVTCRHVVQTLATLNAEAGREAYGFATVINRLLVIGNRFVHPEGDPDPRPGRPDIAIRELHPDFPKAIGKVPLCLRPAPPWDKLTHAIAVGYPTGIKESVVEERGRRVGIPCVHALAEQISPPGNSFQLFSALPDSPGIASFSGMSGGPVYWSSPDEYGLLGLMYEAGPPEPPVGGLAEGPRIQIFAETVTPERFALWVSRVPRLY